jgi:hypothetical protein
MALSLLRVRASDFQDNTRNAVITDRLSFPTGLRLGNYEAGDLEGLVPVSTSGFSSRQGKTLTFDFILQQDSLCVTIVLVGGPPRPQRSPSVPLDKLRKERRPQPFKSLSLTGGAFYCSMVNSLHALHPILVCSSYLLPANLDEQFLFLLA